MARPIKMSVKFRTRYKSKADYSKPFRAPFNIIVSYNKRQLAISCAFACDVIPSWEIFQQLNSDGLPKDPATQDPKVLRCSKLLQKTKRTYMAALEKAVKAGIFQTMNVKSFIVFLLENTKNRKKAE